MGKSEQEKRGGAVFYGRGVRASRSQHPRACYRGTQSQRTPGHLIPQQRLIACQLLTENHQAVLLKNIRFIKVRVRQPDEVRRWVNLKPSRKAAVM